MDINLQYLYFIHFQVFMFVHKKASLIDTTSPKANQQPDNSDDERCRPVPRRRLRSTRRSSQASRNSDDEAATGTADSEQEESSAAKEPSLYSADRDGSDIVPITEENYNVRKFVFDTFKDVNDYWFSLKWISFNTPLCEFIAWWLFILCYCLKWYDLYTENNVLFNMVGDIFVYSYSGTVFKMSKFIERISIFV